MKTTILLHMFKNITIGYVEHPMLHLWIDFFMQYLNNKYDLTLHECVKKVVLDFRRPIKLAHDVGYRPALLKLNQSLGGGVTITSSSRKL